MVRKLAADANFLPDKFDWLHLVPLLKHLHHLPDQRSRIAAIQIDGSQRLHQVRVILDLFHYDRFWCEIATHCVYSNFHEKNLSFFVLMYLFFFLKNKSDSQAVYYSSIVLKHQGELASFFVLMYLFFLENKSEF